MRASASARSHLLQIAVGILATLQVVWCYLRAVHPYMDPEKYVVGTDRMPFQGRVLLMLPLRWAENSHALQWLVAHSWRSVYWFPGPMTSEAIVEASIDVLCIAIAGWMTILLYRASSRRQWLTPAIYPLFLAAFAATYILHTVQNYRFLYDPPSIAFFAVAMWLIYTRQHWGWFVALFLVATLNRETTLLLLPLYAIDRALEDGKLRWKHLFAPRTLALVVPLGFVWAAWTAWVHHHFAANQSEFYPRFDWNLKSLAYPPAWPQMLSPCGFLLVFTVAFRRKISDARLRGWAWILPLWLAFMFTYGILVEVRVWGELIPWIACSSALIAEELLAERLGLQEKAGTDPTVRPISLAEAKKHDDADMYQAA